MTLLSHAGQLVARLLAHLVRQGLVVFMPEDTGGEKVFPKASAASPE